MLGQELVFELRSYILDDVQIPYLWKDLELLRFLNYAEVQACRRSQLLIDSTTSNDNGTAATAGTLGQKSLCNLPLVSGQSVYNLSPKVLQIKRCQLLGMSYPLVGPISYDEADEWISGWMGTSGTVGTCGSDGFPSSYLNEPGNTITFILAPGKSGTANLTVSRLPLSPFTLSTSPEIPEVYHEGLMNWAAHLAYLKNDSETFNAGQSKYYEDLFTAQFGPLPDAKTERMIKVLSQKGRMRARQFGS